jgi:hypothetical protein
MKGINGAPYVDCSTVVDISALERMNMEICSGIALSNPKAGVYGPGVKDSKQFNNFLMLKGKLSGDPQEIEYRWNQMTHDQQNTFAKLYLNLYNPSSVVYLREPKKGLDPIMAYLKKGSDEHFEWTSHASHFPSLVPWLEALRGSVFESFGRVLFFIHEHDCKLLIHRDGMSYAPHKNEFIWLNPGNTKRFFIYDEKTDQRHYVDTPAAFFNDLDMHGGDPTNYASWSLRIDGKFHEDFRKKLGIDGLGSY